MTESDHRRFHEQNRASWNAVTEAHNSHKVDQAGFLRSGGSTLFSDELELLGDLEGRRLVHLQCNCGQDSLSLAAKGAIVTGVDISDAAVSFAQTLSTDSQIPATFERSDLFDWFDENAASDRRFDVAFASYGTIGWLADINRWAKGVANALVSGGRLVLIEFHPLAWSFGPGGRLAEPYFIEAPLDESGVNDYVGGSVAALAPSGWQEGVQNFTNPERCVSFQWTVAQIVQAIADAGLRVDGLREYPYSNGCCIFEGMRTLSGQRFAMPEGLPEMPLMLGVTATKP